ncbi:mitochondrial import inner membrane translocase subunit Tim21 [Eurytemora carolleeae]|uniref:mitochondrial import inner membrane translocase subunit Tim21 n=1 Tax=Eurytemora carolleeae TaxID=1294199 RepID=UPI000C791541|nr:mitochondrial import inner membrane translocase subunit Tim21 [Eurytemora carolleeae]|eukprot:XP_023333362.1 mitochondrial import inner membrane translocase subunit Tim21-like [Eurytemora affinis]
MAAAPRIILRLAHMPRLQSKVICGTCSSRTLSTSTQHTQQTKQEKTVVQSAAPSGGQVQTSFKEKAKDNAKTASYGAVIVVGIGVTGVIAYTVLNELFSSNSPNALYEKASTQCMKHPKVQDMLGEPIKAYGEESRRGRRNRVSHIVYQDEQGRKGVRVQFYLQGRRNRGIAQLDAREDASGKMQTRFLLVTVENFLRNTIIVQDNR